MLNEAPRHEDLRQNGALSCLTSELDGSDW